MKQETDSNSSVYLKVLQLHHYLKHKHRNREDKIIDITEKITGEMWNAEDREYLENQKRPVLEYPLVEAMRNAYVGIERSSRRNLRAVPYKGGSVDTAYLLTSAMAWNYNKTWYDWQKSKQFLNVLVAGISFSHNYWDFNRGHWIFQALDPLRIRWDDTAQDILLRDCAYLQDTQWVTREKLLSLCQSPQIRNELNYQLKFHEPNSNKYYDKHYYGSAWDTDAGGDDRDYTDFRAGRYRAIDHHERRSTLEVFLVNTETEQVVDMTGREEEEVYAVQSQYGGFKRIDTERTEKWQTIIVPAVQMVLREEQYAIDDYDLEFYSFIPQLGYDIKPKLTEAYSVFKNPLKINESFNKRKSVLLEYAIDTVGGDWIAEEGAIDGHEEDWLDRGKRFIRKYNTGTQRPEREKPASVPATLFQYENDEISLFQAVSNLHPNIYGRKESASETGVLYDAKVKQNEMTLQHIFDNALLSQYMEGVACIQHIQKFMTDEQMIKLIGQDEYTALNQEGINGKANALDDGGKYDIELDDTRPSQTARQYAFEQLIKLMQYVDPSMLPLDKVIDATDLPNKTPIIQFIKARYKAMGIDTDRLDSTDPNAMNQMSKVVGRNGMQNQMKQSIEGQEQTMSPQQAIS